MGGKRKVGATVRCPSCEQQVGTVKSRSGMVIRQHGGALACPGTGVLAR